MAEWGSDVENPSLNLVRRYTVVLDQYCDRGRLVPEEKWDFDTIGLQTR